MGPALDVTPQATNGQSSNVIDTNGKFQLQPEYLYVVGIVVVVAVAVMVYLKKRKPLQHIHGHEILTKPKITLNVF